MTGRRRKVLWIGLDDLWNLFGGWCVSGRFMRPEAKNVPYDASCVGVHFDWNRNAFGFVLEHESFEPILDGQELSWAGPLEIEYRTMPPTEAEAEEVDVPIYTEA